MKKLSYLLLMVAVITAGPAFGANSFGLPAVQLAPDCSYTALFEGEVDVFLGILAALELPAPESWAVADFDLDGLPDQGAMSILAGVLCSGNSPVIAQYNANRAAYSGIVTAFNSAVTTQGTPLLTEMTTVSGLCTTASAGLEAIPGWPAPPYDALVPLNTALDTLAATLTSGAGDLQDSIGTFAGYVTLLNTVKDWIAGMSGLSTETRTFITTFLGGLLTDAVYPAGDDLIAQATQLAGAAATIPDGATLTGMGLPSTVVDPIVAAKTGLGTLATHVSALGDALKAVTVPSFVIYGVAKSASEPFSGLADYNGNGDTNAECFTAVVTNGNGSLADYVAAATGANPWYRNNPALPVGGLLGLAALAGACATAGAFGIRRK